MRHTPAIFVFALIAMLLLLASSAAATLPAKNLVSYLNFSSDYQDIFRRMMTEPGSNIVTAGGLIGNGLGMGGDAAASAFVIENQTFLNTTSTAFSVNLWFKENATGNNRNDYIIWYNKTQPANTSFYIYSGTSADKFTSKFKMNDTAAQQSLSMFYTTAKANVWWMATFTYNGSTGCVYINSTLMNCTADGVGFIGGTVGDFFLGSSGQANQYLNGTIDELSLWNTTLTQAQITELYASGSGFPYPFVYTYPYFAEDTLSTSSYLGETSTFQLNCTTPGGALTYAENSSYSTINASGFLTISSASTDLPDVYTIIANCSNGTTVGNATVTFTLKYPASLRTFYVDSVSGSDSNNGLTSDTAIKTISKLNTISMVPGDKILFSRGGKWNLNLDAYPILSSGNSTDWVTYNAYGSGAAPLFIASINLSSPTNWTQDPAHNSTMWRLNGTWDRKIGNLILNDDALYNSNLIYKKSDVNNSGEWHYNTSEKKIYWNFTQNPATYYTEIMAATTADDAHAFNLSRKSYIIIANLSLKQAGIHGIEMGSGDHLKVLDCRFDAIGGAWQNAATRYGNCIQNYGNGTNFDISRNNFSNCYDAAISPQYTSTKATVFENLTYQYNLIVDSRYPFEYFNTNDTSTVANILFDHNTIISAENKFLRRLYAWVRIAQSNCTVTNFNITNNVFVGDNSTLAIGYSFNETNDYWYGAPPNLDYNFYNKTEPFANTLRFNGVTYSSLAAFKAAITNFEVNSIEGKPLFLAGTYKPASNSPICTMSNTGSYVGAFPCASVESYSIVTTTPCVAQFAGYSGTYDITYTYARNSAAYSALGSIITTFTTIPTWLGIIIVVAFAFAIFAVFRMLGGDGY